MDAPTPRTSLRTIADLTRCRFLPHYMTVVLCEDAHDSQPLAAQRDNTTLYNYGPGVIATIIEIIYSSPLASSFLSQSESRRRRLVDCEDNCSKSG